ncbi:FIG00720420: hypothetical protein [Candidatus Phaeomarinobacter ectocarpi]|uniref:DUF3576 domain-containing protein n=1 Tax=Candidatus Phaeomarinibacter ectocarpi TaxID=1458461 RepID=X5MD15_9HYPH|nr:DUF3576 domain-containing protein [Candidatus Phaeomarinobacter ectocarpi]CDO59757.1 FIG00720420: hypothetical protein [Candidatus Phaeomarinobacter ectocarpi]
MNYLKIFAVSIAIAFGLSACGTGIETENRFPTEKPGGKSDPFGRAGNEPGVFGEGGLFGLGGGGSSDDGNANGIGVNSFLWRASLDTTSFMPLSSADPFGGVIITDWFTAPEAPSERFKMTIYILDTSLRADGVKVSVFKQAQAPDGAGWVDAAVTPGTAAQLENAILIRARQLRIDTLAAEE